MKPVLLEDRRDDVLSLARRYIKAADELIHTGPKELSEAAAEYLLSRSWRTDESRIEDAVKKACILSEGRILQKEDFDLDYRHVKSIGGFIENRLKGFMSNIKSLEKFNLYDTVIPEVERALILMVMKETKGNQSKSAKLLGINRNTLRDKIKKLKIKVKP